MAFQNRVFKPAIDDSMITTKEKLYTALPQIRFAIQSLAEQQATIHGLANASGYEGLRDFMEAAGTMGGWLTLLSMSNGVNVNQNHFLSKMEADLPRAASIMRAVEGYLTGDQGAKIGALAPLDQAFCQSLLADLSLYAAMKASGDYIGIEAVANLATNADGTVAVAAKPQPELPE